MTDRCGHSNKKATMLQKKPTILLNRLGAVGDVILTTPIVEGLYQKYGGFCDISIRTFSGDVYKNNPYIKEILHPHQAIDIGSYNIFINLDSVYENNPSIHILDAYEYHVFGALSLRRQAKIYPSTSDQEHVDHLLKNSSGDYLVLHMRNIQSAVPWQNSRNLPVDFWRAVIEKLLKESKFHIVQIGTQEDLAFDQNPRLVDARNKLSIQQLHELFKNAKAFAGVDSAPFHIAGTTNIPIVALFTTARFEYRKPYRHKVKFIPITAEIECYGCLEKQALGSTGIDCHRGDVECRNRFNPDHVYENIMRATQ
jgi:ADP-heptose:LPS heptosyltransferase